MLTGIPTIIESCISQDLKQLRFLSKNMDINPLRHIKPEKVKL